MSVVNGLPSKFSPPTDSNAEKRNQCNDVAMKVILCGLSDDVSSQLDRCRSTKSLWDKLKKLYRNEPTTTKPICEEKMRNVTHAFADDEGISVSSHNGDEEGTHLFMAQESKDERYTTKNDHADHSYWRDVFGNDSEGEEEDEA